VQEFNEVVTMAESTARIRKEITSTLYSAVLSFQKVFTAALYFTAIKCRNPEIRRRALALLKQPPKGEAFGDSVMVASIVEKVIVMEEEGLEGLRDDLGGVVPDEWARVCDILVAGGKVSSNGGTMIAFRRKWEGENRDVYFDVDNFMK
jgi:hypothetical protein